MLSHVREAQAFIRGRTRADLDADRMLSLALVRLLEIVGEAAANVSRAERARHPHISWPQIVALRNRLIHAYGAIDLDVVWGILIADVPLLIAELEKTLPPQPEAP